MKMCKNRVFFFIKIIFVGYFGAIAQESTVDSSKSPISQESIVDSVVSPQLQKIIIDSTVSSQFQKDSVDTVTVSKPQKSDAKAVKISNTQETQDSAKVLNSQTDTVKTSKSKNDIIDTVILFKQQDLIIESIKSSKPPEIKAQKIIYSIDIKFLRVPLEYWFFYDTSNSRLVCDFYGTHIEVMPELSRRVSVVEGVDFENMETSLALNGKRSQLYFDLEPGWHYSSAIISGEILRLSLWKQLKPEEVIKYKQKRLRKILTLVFSGVAIVSAVLTYYLN